MLVFLFIASIAAGAMNSLAGGGSFVVYPALLFAGLDARAANITATVSQFPGQFAGAVASRYNADGAQGLSLRVMIGLSFVGGVLGALLLLATPTAIFERMVPWLVLFAVSVYTWGNFLRKKSDTPQPAKPLLTAGLQLAAAVYGGYFGGGIGFMLLAILTLAGQSARIAGSTKNILVCVMNAAAITAFVTSPDVHWLEGAMVAGGTIIGGIAGAWMLPRIDERKLAVLVVCVGVALTIGLFWRLG